MVVMTTLERVVGGHDNIGGSDTGGGDRGVVVSK